VPSKSQPSPGEFIDSSAVLIDAPEADLSGLFRRRLGTEKVRRLADKESGGVRP
jgi:hypothetical protein